MHNNSSRTKKPNVSFLWIITILLFACWPVQIQAQSTSDRSKEEAILRELDELYFFQKSIDERGIVKRVLEILSTIDRKLMPRVWLRSIPFLNGKDLDKYFDGNFDPLLQSALDLNDHTSYITLLRMKALTLQAITPRAEILDLYAKARHSACEVLKNPMLCGFVWTEEAYYLYALNDMPSCLTTLKKGLDILQNIKGRSRLQFYMAQNVLALALAAQGDGARSINLHEENLQWYRANGFFHAASITGTNIVNSLIDIEPLDTDKVRYYIGIARELSRKVHDLGGLAYLDWHEGILLMKEKRLDFVKAKRLFEQSYNAFLELKDVRFAANTKIWSAEASLGMGRIKEAWQAIAEAEALITPEFKGERIKLLEIMSKVAAGEGDHKAAYEHLQRFHDAWKLQKEEEEAKGLERLSANLTLQVEEERNKALRQENAAQAAELRTARLLLTLGIVLLIVTVIAVRSTVVARRKNRLLIASQTRIKQILSTIDEGLLVVDENGRIGGDYSAHLEQLFDPAVPFAEQDFVTRIPGYSRMPEEEVSIVREVFHAVLGEDRLAWELNAANLPKEMQLGENFERIIELRWIPIFSSEEVMKGLLVGMTDVTEKRALEETLGSQRKYIQALPDVLRELLQAEPGLTGRLLEKAGALMSRVESQKTSITDFQRDLHTHKGEARSLGLKALSQQLHALESWLQTHAVGDVRNPHFILQLEQVQERIVEYCSFADILHRETRSESLDMPWLGAMLTQQLSGARRHLKAAELALGEIRLSDAHLAWTREQVDVLHVFAIHALNNSMDHGFIIPHSTGQTIAEPTLEITARGENGELVLEISDNGAGLNLEVLTKVAKARGFIPRPDETVADLVFYDGVSTAEKVTESSGRGVGLAAVKADIEKRGGRVGIRNHPEHRGTVIWASLPLQTAGERAV